MGLQGHLTLSAEQLKASRMGQKHASESTWKFGKPDESCDRDKYRCLTSSDACLSSLRVDARVAGLHS